MKRVAVCFSGQLRTWKKVFETWEYLVFNEEIEVDYFFHAWEENTIPKFGVLQSNLELFDLPENEKEEIVEFLKPKLFKFESQKWFNDFVNAKEYINPYSCQYYSMMESAKLKTQYEQENGFQYDAVIKCRFDLLLQEPIIFDTTPIDPNTIYACHCLADENDVLYRITDLLFYSDSPTFDKLCSYHNHVDDIPEELKDYSKPAELVWFKFIVDQKINFIRNYWEIRVMRNDISEIKNLDFSYETY